LSARDRLAALNAWCEFMHPGHVLLTLLGYSLPVLLT